MKPPVPLTLQCVFVCLTLLRDLSRKRGITLLLISHDLWAVRRFCDDIAIMYGGRVVEHGPAKQVFNKPAHPYTQALLNATAGHEKPGKCFQLFRAYRRFYLMLPKVAPLPRAVIMPKQIALKSVQIMKKSKKAGHYCVTIGER